MMPEFSLSHWRVQSYCTVQWGDEGRAGPCPQSSLRMRSVKHTRNCPGSR